VPFSNGGGRCGGTFDYGVVRLPEPFSPDVQHGVRNHIGNPTGSTSRVQPSLNLKTRIEEIGPKSSKALEVAGIQTFAQLAQSSEAHLEACHLLQAARPGRNRRRSCSRVTRKVSRHTPTGSSPVVNTIHCKHEWNGLVPQTCSGLNGINTSPQANAVMHAASRFSLVRI
jgi:hypothetical protein